jgi:hypothetical protein
LEYNRKRREKKVFFAQEHSRTKGVDAIGDSTPWRAAEDGPSLMVGVSDDPLGHVLRWRAVYPPWRLC